MFIYGGSLSIIACLGTSSNSNVFNKNDGKKITIAKKEIRVNAMFLNLVFNNLNGNFVYKLFKLNDDVQTKITIFFEIT